MYGVNQLPQTSPQLTSSLKPKTEGADQRNLKQKDKTKENPQQK